MPDVLTIGIDNGSQNPQITGTLGTITQTSGSYVQLSANTVNKIYVTQAVTTLGLPSNLVLAVYSTTTATITIN